MPRVAHVISTPKGVGGAERVLAALVREGARRGWEQLVLNPFGYGSGELAESLRDLPYEAFPCSSWGGVPALRKWLRGRLHEWQPDLVHAHLFHALVATATIRIPGVVKIASHHHGALYTQRRERTKAFLDRAAGTRYDLVVGVSSSVSTFLRSHYHYDDSKVTTIVNGWEGKPLERSPEERPPTIVAVANFAPHKGHAVLLSAFELVAAAVPDARLVLVGDGEQTTELKRTVQNIGLTERVEFPGWCDVWPLLARADVFALPSLYESLGIAALEAMAAGLPVVASETGGIPELVQAGVTGELVPPGDADALAGSLVDLLGNPDKATAMGEAGREAAQRFHMSRTVASYVGLYERLLGSV